ncbi:hypothetical protein Fmac_017082 [Flemingia macrophylla]|uniref:Protein ABA DEFICIENT 4, chloroplastic n=1 Tax=Flemingia macrophylla TaxID=520843 RepID=A0ABD1M136_9FABA
MSLSLCFAHSPLTLKAIKPCSGVGKGLSFPSPTPSSGAELCNRHIVRSRVNLSGDWSFIGGGSRITMKPEAKRLLPYPKRSRMRASCVLVLRVDGTFPYLRASYRDDNEVGFLGSELASTAFTVGTVAVLPFYTLMVVAPNSELTKKSMESSIPYIVLGILYAYLLYLSWTPETIRLIFASKYLLPELTGIAKMFSSEMTLASAWIHLLVVDLFAARHVYQDGMKNQIETRHSVSFCLFFCPIGILTHAITKAMTKSDTKEGHA